MWGMAFEKSKKMDGFRGMTFERSLEMFPSNVNVDVTEKRAPTDESVKLLREMEQRAREQVLKAISINNTEVEGVLHMMRNHLSCTYVFRFLYQINGKKMTTDYEVNEFELPKYKWIDGLINAVAVDIAREILLKPFSNITKELNNEVSVLSRF